VWRARLLRAHPCDPHRREPLRKRLAASSLYNLFSAFRNNELDYAPFYLTEDPADVSRELRALLRSLGFRER
jgi:hypothetical protein